MRNDPSNDRKTIVFSVSNTGSAIPRWWGRGRFRTEQQKTRRGSTKYDGRKKRKRNKAGERNSED